MQNCLRVTKKHPGGVSPSVKGVSGLLSSGRGQNVTGTYGARSHVFDQGRPALSLTTVNFTDLLSVANGKSASTTLPQGWHPALALYTNVTV